MSFEIIYPSPKQKVTIETPFMCEVMRGVMDNSLTGNMSLWYGGAGIGKTTLAEHLEMKINEAFRRSPESPIAFRAKHYQVTELQESSGNEQKQGIRSIFVAMGVTLSEGEYRFRQAHELAEDAVETARRKRYRIFFLDEAGTLSIGAIRGIVAIRDKSVKEGWPISFIFIGMDDLPQKLNDVPQIRRRINPWVYFEEYSFDDTWDLLSKLHPHFEKLKKESEDHVAQVKFIYETFGGYPGLIVQFLNELDSAGNVIQTSVNEKFLRSVHYLMTYPKDKAIETSRSLHKARPPQTTRSRRRR